MSGVFPIAGWCQRLVNWGGIEPRARLPEMKPSFAMPCALEMLIACCAGPSIWATVSAARLAVVTKRRTLVLNIDSVGMERREVGFRCWKNDDDILMGDFHLI